MSFLVESQQNPAWSGVELGWGPPGSTIGAFGCLLTDFSMIAIDTGHNLNPAQLNAAMVAHGGIFVLCGGGDVDHDCLPDNALDILFPGEYQTHHVDGFDVAGIKAAVDSPDTYVILYILTATITHFAIAYSDTAQYLADPWIGKVDTLAGYGGSGVIRKTTYVRHLPPPTPPPPPPPPTPAPTPTPPPPAPTWVVENDQDVVVGSLYTTLVEAKSGADKLAAAAPGKVFTVEDDSGIEVYTADVVPPPPPPGPTPGPNPPQPPQGFWEYLLYLIKKLLGG